MKQVPKIIKHAGAPKKLPRKYDLLICAASYENRSLGFPFSLQRDTFDQVIICVNDDVEGDGTKHSVLLKDHFGSKADVAVLSKRNPIKSADNIRASLHQYEEGRNYNCVIDVTTFTHESLLIILKMISLFFSENSTVSLGYTPAKEYDPGTETKSKWLSRGVREVRSILGYSGSWVPSGKVHLVVLPGLETDRSKKMIDSFEPDLLSLGDASVEPFNSEIEAARYSFFQELSASYPKCNRFKFSAKDPLSVKEAIREQVNIEPDYNVVIIPMNTKLSTFGAGLYAIEDERIKMAYSSALSYNSANYSSSEDYSLFFEDILVCKN